jgi:two-component system cell cycle response regulator
MRKLNALIIDSDPIFVATSTEILEKAGFVVTSTESGLAALELAEKESFRLVCCGQNLPDIRGCELCGQLRAISGYDFSSILVLTTEDNSRILKQALLAGATDIFSKHDIKEFATYVERYAERELRQLSGRVLLLEDSRVVLEIVLDLLTDMGLDVDAYTHAEDAWAVFQEGSYDLVITDVMLEGMMSGISFVRKIRRLRGEMGNVPVIATSGFDNISRKIELFHLGVNDYVAKPIVREELKQRVFNHVTGYQKMLELRSQQNSLHSLAMLDELTQLFNRHALREFSGKYFSEAARFKRPLTVAVLDIDHFKKINEEEGHEKADEVLAELGAWLKRFVRDEDMIARWSGEEFIFLLPNCDNEKALGLMTRLQKRLTRFKPANIHITVSIGLATSLGEPENTLNAMFEHADRAMYQAKMSGRNCINSYEPETVEAEL